MIPLTAIPWRLIGYALAVAAVVALGWRIHAWREAYKALPDVQAELEAEIACGEGSKCAARAAELQQKAAEASREVVDGYEQELARVRSERPRRVVRLCSDGSGLPVSGARPGAAGGAAPGGVLPEHPGRDLGPDLYALAREADELTAQCRALIRWNRALAGE